MPEMPPAGWYPAPHADNEQRYWDGTRWLEPQPAAATAVLQNTHLPTVESGPAPRTPAVLAILALVVGIVAFLTGIVPVVGAIFGAGAIALAILALLKNQSKGLAITGIVLGALAMVSSVAVTAGISAFLPASDSKPAVVQSADPAEEVEEQPAATIVVPDVVGLPVADAIALLTEAGFAPPALSSFDDPAALVVSTSRAAGSDALEGAAISVVVQEKPKLTLGQQNAIATAQDYLAYSGFSRTGLIGQLEYEGFSTEEATFGADNAGADWNAEAAETAADYLDYSPFSRQGLYDQLAYEGFQAAEIEYALSQVGY